jgi:hypothetical protein
MYRDFNLVIFRDRSTKQTFKKSFHKIEGDTPEVIINDPLGSMDL